MGKNGTLRFEFEFEEGKVSSYAWLEMDLQFEMVC